MVWAKTTESYEQNEENYIDATPQIDKENVPGSYQSQVVVQLDRSNSFGTPLNVRRRLFGDITNWENQETRFGTIPSQSRWENAN